MYLCVLIDEQSESVGELQDLSQERVRHAQIETHQSVS